jgi:hypothetical protein
MGSKTFTLEELENMPTLAVGQAANLKVENLDAGVRIWVNRCVDGQIEVEVFNPASGRWEDEMETLEGEVTIPA